MNSGYGPVKLSNAAACRILCGDWRTTIELASGRKDTSKKYRRRRHRRDEEKGEPYAPKNLHLHRVRPALEDHVHQPQDLLLRKELLKIQPLRAVRLHHMIQDRGGALVVGDLRYQ